VRPGGHQRGARAVPGVVVLEVPFYPNPDESGWSSLGKQTIRFVGRHELVPASVLVSTFASRTISCSVATSSGLFSTLGFALPSAEELLLDPVFPGRSQVDQQRVHSLVLLAHASDQVLLLHLRKPNGPV
jgi:hypothetical protein